MQGDVEVVDAIERSGYSLTVGQRNGHGAGCAADCRGGSGGAASTSGASAAGREPVSLKLLRRIAAADSLEIAGGGMAGTALARSVEVGLALFGIAGQNIQIGVSDAMARAVGLDAQPGGDVFDFRIGQFRSGHAFAGEAVLNGRFEQNALLILEDIEGADKIGVVLASHTFGRGAMATGANIREKLCSARNLRSVLLRSRDCGLGGGNGGFFTAAGLSHGGAG